MIIMQLVGGLGNQLFQYAAARRLAQHNGVEFALDFQDHQGLTPRTYRLGYFKGASPKLRARVFHRLAYTTSGSA